MLLALDTANQNCAACLYDDKSNQTLAVSQESIGRGHAEYLLPAILETFATAFPNAKAPEWHRLTKVAVSIGPGSFTGLRVGVSVARSIGLSQNIPCIGISAFEAIRAQYMLTTGQQDQPICVAQDARRNEIFFQYFDQPHEAFTPNGEAKALSHDAFVQLINDRANGNTPLTLIGSASKILNPKDLSQHINLIDHDGEIEIERLAELAAQKPAPHDKPKPLYIRAADAKPQSPLKHLAPKSH